MKTKIYYEIHSTKGYVKQTSDTDDVKKALSKNLIVIEVQETVFYITEAVIKTTVSRQVKQKTP
jgi:hypothetical protein